MNPIIYYAFSDELEKIAKVGGVTQVARRLFSSRAPRTAYTSGDELLGLMRSADDVVLTGERGIHSLGKQQGSLQRSMESAEAAARASAAAEEQMAAKLEAALRSGEFNQAKHSVSEFMRTGKIVPKKAPVQAPQWRPEGTGAVQVPGPAVNVRVPPAATGPVPSMPGPPPGTYRMPGAPPPPVAAPPPAAAAAPARTGTVIHQPTPPPSATGSSTWRPTRKQLGTGAALLGAGGFGGYSMS